MTDRITAADFRAQQASQSKEGRIKGTERATIDGINFDSKREARRYLLLRQRQRAGEITELQCQVPIELEGAIDMLRTPTGQTMRYIADFRYWDIKLQAYVIEDAKGHPTDTYQMKRAVIAAMGLEIREV